MYIYIYTVYNIIGKEEKAMPDVIKKLLDKYWDKFGEGFPLYQAPTDWSQVEYSIKKCLRENKTAAQLWPDIYGAREGYDY